MAHAPTPSGITISSNGSRSTEVATESAASQPPATSSFAAGGDGFAIDLGGSITPTPRSREILDRLGGVEAVKRITRRFYENFHADAHLRQFLGGLQQPLDVHAHRLGSYISEMMHGTDLPWTRDLKTRERCPIRLANGRTAIVTDRFSAHHCAWHSVDRPSHLVGRRFKLDDCRVWMRLLFLAVRQSGITDRDPFFRYLQKFVGHFIAVYEVTARPFVLESSRWSASEERLRDYESAGRLMSDVVAVPFAVARKSLPPAEVDLDDWLYGGQSGTPQL